jgi:hypothetical protein
VSYVESALCFGNFIVWSNAAAGVPTTCAVVVCSVTIRISPSCGRRRPTTRNVRIVTVLWPARRHVRINWESPVRSASGISQVKPKGLVLRKTAFNWTDALYADAVCCMLPVRGETHGNCDSMREYGQVAGAHSVIPREGRKELTSDPMTG